MIPNCEIRQLLARCPGIYRACSCFPCINEELQNYNRISDSTSLGFYKFNSDFTVVEANAECHVYAISVGSPFQNARRIIPGHLMHRLLIIIHYTVHCPLSLQQLALTVSLVAIVGMIGDVSKRRILIMCNCNDMHTACASGIQRHLL